MSDNTQVSRGGGLSLGSVLFVIFLVLKLTGVIDWSWWYVTMPLWIGPALLIAGGLVFLVFAGLFLGADKAYGLIDKKHAEKRRKAKNARAARKAIDNYAKALTRR